MGLASARCLADDGARIAIIEQWSEAFDEGVMGMVRCVRAAPPTAPEGGVGAHRQLLGALDATPKCHSAGVHRGQGGVDERLQELIAAAGKDEILVNVVSPGSIASESLVGWATSVGVDGNDPYRLMDAIAEHFGHPAHLPRAGLPHEMGSVVAFLASRRNSYMTGANVNVDGGSDFT
jgi:NAD(P)-dependent dehydrogenase (short-subunit alcohol dehydrogenase family)